MTDPWPPPTYDPAATQRGLAEQVRQILATAHALADAGRTLDLAGLDDAVGVLCAKTLDLPPADGRAARSGLTAILAELDLLGATLRAEGPP